MSTWLPPEQTETRKWPVVGERAPSPAALDLEAWSLEVVGCVERPLSLSIREVLARGTHHLTADIHCVTRWSHRAMSFQGFPLADLLDAAGTLPEARYVRFTAFSDRNHDTGLPLEIARRDTWLIHAAQGAPLTVEHGYPLRTVTLGRYFYKSLKWVGRIELLGSPAPGYWERTDGYHENADPWPGDERYVSGSVPPESLERFRAATDFAPYRGRTLRGLDLRGWRPKCLELQGLSLKNCDFRGALLSGADLRGANLTMGNLRAADLRGADLREADLEGAWLAGADLTGANLRGSLLTGASFFTGAGLFTGAASSTGAAELDATDGAIVTGAHFGGAQGLLEGQHRFLESRAVGEGRGPGAGFPTPD